MRPTWGSPCTRSAIKPPHGALAGHVAPLLVDDDFESGGVGFVLQGFGGGQAEGVELLDEDVFAAIEDLADEEFVGAGPGSDDDGVDLACSRRVCFQGA